MRGGFVAAASMYEPGDVVDTVRPSMHGDCLTAIGSIPPPPSYTRSRIIHRIRVVRSTSAMFTAAMRNGAVA